MNLGIVIAVSDYGSLGNNLPGCETDGKAISTILKTDSKFEDVLFISKTTSSGEVKPLLIDFINRHKDEEIDDVVFYFTGHGDFSGDEFYFLLSDYDRKRKKQTSLENSELDNLLRALKPNNAVKIVDACHAGTPYIKDPDSFDTYLKGTQGEFSKCYFMFSSQADQYSYQDSHLSYFTKSVVESIYNHPSDAIRYKDIIDHVSDSFSDNQSQTPFFIVQADFTESFCTVSDTLKSSISNFLSENTQKLEDHKHENQTIVELIQNDASKYCSEDEAISGLEKIIEMIKQAPLIGEVNDIYQTSYFEESDYSDIPSPAAIGKWIDTKEHEYFAEAKKQNVQVPKRVPKNPLDISILTASRILGDIDDDDDRFKTVIKTESRITGFQSTVDLPLTFLKIVAEPKFPNVKAAVAYVVPIISKTSLQFFISFEFYEEQGWDERKSSGRIKWTTKSLQLKETESFGELANYIMNEYSEFLLLPLKERFGLDNNNDIEENEDQGNEGA